MDNSISIIFGIPKHGWLPVDFRYKNFHIEFHASDVLNDSIEELYNAVASLQNNQKKRITWWLEPGAYLFDIDIKPQNIVLTILETDDLHDEKADKKILIEIAGSENKIIEPFRAALKQFSSQTYEENHWPYNLDIEKIKGL